MFGRKRKVPADVRAKFDRDERVVASASTVDANAAVVVTNRGLWLPGRERLGWHQIHKATWAGSRLTVVAGGQGGRGRRLRGDEPTTYLWWWR